jgi:predicted peroxiredoxin/TusA-related sulfurtransferase
MTASGPTKTIDARGTHVSNDLLAIVVENLSDLAVGDTLEVLTEDFQAIDNDLRSWSAVTGHEIIAAGPAGGGLRFLLRKGQPLTTAHKLVAVVSSDRSTVLDAPLGFATAAAVEGLEVSVFFRGAGVRLLDKGYTPRRHLRRIFSRKRRRVRREDVFRLFDNGVDVYACALSMEDYGVTARDLLFSDIAVVEYPTIVKVMEEADIHIIA